MLPRTARMTRAGDFRATIRHGIRVGRSTLVIHAHRFPDDTARVGFVVNKAVGNAVTRNRVKRQLRHLAANCLSETPPAAHLVVRALPSSAQLPIQVRTDFASAWRKACDRLVSAPQRSPQPSASRGAR